jgi:hypothetical protein
MKICDILVSERKVPVLGTGRTYQSGPLLSGMTTGRWLRVGADLTNAHLVTDSDELVIESLFTIRPHHGKTGHRSPQILPPISTRQHRKSSQR